MHSATAEGNPNLLKNKSEINNIAKKYLLDFFAPGITITAMPSFLKEVVKFYFIFKIVETIQKFFGTKNCFTGKFFCNSQPSK